MTRGLRAAIVLLVVVAGWAAFRQFGDIRVPIPDDWFEAALKLSFWVAPCAILLRLWGARNYRDVALELGLSRSALRGYAFALAASLPLLVPVLLGGSLRSVPLSVLVSTVLVSPFAEEVLFRGWLFRQLARHCGWPPVVALLLSAFAFGLAHVPNLAYLVLDPSAFAAATGAAAAGLLFGWLTWRWDSLWPAIGLHACINLSAQGGATSIATIGRFATIGLAVVLTFVFRRARTRQWGGETVGQWRNEAMRQ